MRDHSESQPLLKRLKRTRVVPLATTATSVLALASGAMLAFAMPEIIGDQSWTDLIKAAVIAAAATVTTFVVTRLAVEKGAPQAAIGMRGAAAVSVASIAVIGFGLFTATYAGQTMRETEQLRLQDYGREIAAYIDERALGAAEAGRVVPILDAIVDDLGVKQECEAVNSCLSGRGFGGRGAVWRLLGEKRQRAEAVSAQVDEGETARTRAIGELNALLSDYQRVLTATDLDATKQRESLQSINARIGQELSALDQSVPTDLLSAYAFELRTPVVIAGARETSAKLTGLLSSYADGLDQTLRNAEIRDDRRPSFPAKAGVASTLSYLGHFLPIAAIVAVVELVFPISLWLYTLFALQARVVRDDPDGDDDTLSPDSFSRLVSMKPIVDEASVQAKPEGRGRRAKSGREAV
ncbi:MAG: hypothetical protein KDK08_29170 [Rhizobiaceae bacterium]|nr:hypothetical protein [Rhizobiaceae bacterium]